MLYKNAVNKTLMIAGKEIAAGETIELDPDRCNHGGCPYIRLGYLVPVEKTEAKKPKKKKVEEPIEEPEPEEEKDFMEVE